MRIKLTRAQRSAVEIYIVDSIHENDGKAWLDGSTLVLAGSDDDAYRLLVDAANSADAGAQQFASDGDADSARLERGACVALSNLASKALRAKEDA